MKDKLINYLAPEGRSISKRFSEKAFHNSGNSALIDFVNGETTSLVEGHPFEIRCWAAMRGLTIQQYCRTCNSPIMTKTENGWDRYCNKECRIKDPNISSMMKERRKKVDESLAMEKRKATMVERFGVEFAGQRESHKKSLSEKAKVSRIETNPLLEDREYLYRRHVTEKTPVTKIADELGVWYETVSIAIERMGIPYTPNCGGYNRSGLENEVAEYIESFGLEIVRGNRNVIGMELDIYIPELNLAIEFNGVYWHSIGTGENDISPDYHYNKTNLCIEKGIRLIHVNEFEWIYKKDIIKSMLSNAVGKTETRVYARELIVSEISSKDKKEFFEENHIHGDSQSKINLCLKKDNVVYAVISFAVPRFSKEADWEIVRFASLLNTNVVGGFSKLLSSFRKDFTGTILSYSDRMKGTGKVYERNGFSHVRTTKPGYMWCDRKNIYSRTRFMKKSLPRLLGDRFDSSKSETANMFGAGYRKFFDSGHDLWILQEKKDKTTNR